MQSVCRHTQRTCVAMARPKGFAIDDSGCRSRRTNSGSPQRFRQFLRLPSMHRGGCPGRPGAMPGQGEQAGRSGYSARDGLGISAVRMPPPPPPRMPMRSAIRALSLRGSELVWMVTFETLGASEAIILRPRSRRQIPRLCDDLSSCRSMSPLFAASPSKNARSVRGGTRREGRGDPRLTPNAPRHYHVCRSRANADDFASYMWRF